MKMYIKNGVLTVVGLSLVGLTVFKLNKNKDFLNDIRCNNTSFFKEKKSNNQTVFSWEDETVKNNRHYKTLTRKR